MPESYDDFTERVGFSISHMLALWGRLFATRKDIRAKRPSVGKPLPKAKADALDEMPQDWVRFARESQSLKFRWETDGDEKGGVDIQPVHRADWDEMDEGWEAETLFDYGNMDEPVSFAYRAEQPPAAAELIRADAEDSAPAAVGLSMTEYLTAGARQAFTLYWQADLQAPPQPAVRARSLDATKPEAITAALQARGATSDEATAMVRWLGDAVVLLVPRRSDAELKAMVRTLTKAQDGFFKGKPTMKDAEYDALKIELAELDPDNKFLDRMPRGVTAWPRKAHPLPWPDGVTVDDLEDWLSDTQTRLQSSNVSKVELRVKYISDGMPVSLRYQGGRLVEALTKGDGQEGENILRNLKKVPEVVTRKCNVKNGLVRGVLFVQQKWEATHTAKDVALNLKSPKDCKVLWFQAHEVLLADDDGSYEDWSERQRAFPISIGMSSPNFAIVGANQVREVCVSARERGRGPGFIVEYENAQAREVLKADATRLFVLG